MEKTDHEKMVAPETTEATRCIPVRPEKTGYHWVRRWPRAPAIPLWWNADWQANGGEGWGRYAQPDREDRWEYLGPCHSPGE